MCVASEKNINVICIFFFVHIFFAGYAFFSTGGMVETLKKKRMKWKVIGIIIVSIIIVIMCMTNTVTNIMWIIRGESVQKQLESIGEILSGDVGSSEDVDNTEDDKKTTDILGLLKEMSTNTEATEEILRMLQLDDEKTNGILGLLEEMSTNTEATEEILKILQLDDEKTTGILSILEEMSTGPINLNLDFPGDATVSLSTNRPVEAVNVTMGAMTIVDATTTTT